MEIRKMIYVYAALVLLLILSQSIFWSMKGSHTVQTKINNQHKYPEDKHANGTPKSLGQSTVENVFATDFDPTKVERSETVHFCVTAGIKGAEAEFEVLLKSAVLHSRRLKTHFHIIAGDGSEGPIKTLMERITSAHVPFLYEIKVLDKTFVKEKALTAQISINHHSGVYGMSKAFLFRIWQRVEKCIYVDTDAVFGTDPAFMWAEFKRFNEKTIMMMRLSEKGPAGAGAGVVLLHLQRMRDMKFDSLYPKIVKDSKICHPVHGKGSLQDRVQKKILGGMSLKTAVTRSQVQYECEYMEQGMLFSFYVSKGRNYFMKLDHSWGLELCHKFDGFKFKTHRRDQNGLFFGVAHLNCIKGEHLSFSTFANDKSNGYYHLRSYLTLLMRTPLGEITNGMIASSRVMS